jgi:hypothetical protein
VQVAAHFVVQRGIHVIVSEACRDAPLASTLTLLCEILRLFARSHADDVFRAPIGRAVSCMLTFVTKRGADERQMDVDVKLAALTLVQLLHTEGEPLATVCGRASAAEVRARKLDDRPGAHVASCLSLDVPNLPIRQAAG